MKNLHLFGIATFVVAFFVSIQVKATDLVVAPGGTGGTYASLNAAIAAASAGDRIIVYPQANGASYSETAITITKSLQILSANEGAFYTVDAPSITIAPTTAASSITIIGMKLISGGIATSANAPAGARSSINILNDSIMSGALNVNHDNYNVTAAANYIYSGVVFKFGKVIGNFVTSSITCNNDASTNNVGDTSMIIGNRVFYYTAGNNGGVNWNNSNQYFSIQNNFIRLDYPGNATNFGIYVQTGRNSAVGTNVINNNTILKQTYSIYYGMTINTGASSVTEIMNNVIVAPLYGGGLITSAGNYDIHYNYTTNASYGGFTNDGTNVAPTNTSINAANGLITNALSNTINGGTPDSAYSDINLTRNDAGCYGGSYTQDNFFPITGNDWARVILVTAPRRVMVNGTINVKAIGYDK